MSADLNQPTQSSETYRAIVIFAACAVAVVPTILLGLMYLTIYPLRHVIESRTKRDGVSPAIGKPRSLNQLAPRFGRPTVLCHNNNTL